MKRLILVSVTFVAFVFLSCEKENESQFNGSVTFSFTSIASDVLVKYSDIEAYDSAQHVFQLNTNAWEKIKDEVSPSDPDPHFSFNVMIENEVIYTARYIPGYYSSSNDTVITFLLFQNKFVHMVYGYPGGNYIGNENVNDDRIIEILSNDGKLKSIDL